MIKDLYVRNFPPETGEEEVRKLFSVAGKVSYIHLVTDDKTGEFKGCGYIKMASEAEAKEAINCLDGARLEGGHILSVTEALPQKSKTGGQREQRPRPPAKAGERPKVKTGDRPPAKTGPRLAAENDDWPKEKNTDRPRTGRPRPPAKAGERPKGKTGGRPSAKPGSRPPAKTGGRRK